MLIPRILNFQKVGSSFVRNLSTARTKSDALRKHDRCRIEIISPGSQKRMACRPSDALRTMEDILPLRVLLSALILFTRFRSQKGGLAIRSSTSSSEGWWTIFLFFRKILSTSNWRIFRVSKGGAFSLLEKFSGRNWNFILPQKRV